MGPRGSDRVALAAAARLRARRAPFGRGVAGGDGHARRDPGGRCDRDERPRHAQTLHRIAGIDDEKRALEAQIAKLTEGKSIPDFGPGDTIKVNVKVVEGTRERVQAARELGVVLGANGCVQASANGFDLLSAFGVELDRVPGRRRRVRQR